MFQMSVKNVSRRSSDMRTKWPTYTLAVHCNGLNAIMSALAGTIVSGVLSSHLILI